MARSSAAAALLILVLQAAVAVPAHAVLKLDIDGEVIVKQLLDLALLSDDPSPAVTRVLFTPHDMHARGFVKALMRDAGLEVREDAMGNIFGRLSGSQDKGAVSTGSHCDAIPLAGAYDGTTGVIGGIAALAALRRAGFKPCRPLDAMMFTSEEPTRFGLGCIGSRGMAGTLDAKTLDAKLDVNGTTFWEAANAAGYGGKDHEDILAHTRVPAGDVDFFVELHIEQGPLLEREALQLGDGVLRKIHAAAQEIAQRRKVRHSVEVLNQDPPAACGDKVQAAALAAAQRLGYSHKSMVSRAYHDSLFMAQIAPTGMIFIPCRGGWSHRPDEFASPADIARGVEVLAHTMAELSCDGVAGDHSEL